MERISLLEVEHIAFRLAQEHLAFDEPIPDFSTRFRGILESCVKVPFQRFFGQVPYRSLVAKASILFYLLIKNHPFQNGNKRIAITTLLVFLQKNGKWLRVDQDEFHRFTVWIAAGKARDKDYAVMSIETFLRRHLMPLPQAAHHSISRNLLLSQASNSPEGVPPCESRRLDS